MSRPLAAVVAVCLFFAPHVVFAQSSRRAASLTVNVIDATGLPIVGATVDVSHAGASTVLETLATDARGQALIERLRPGPYAVRVTLDGFSDYLQPKLTLKPGVNRLSITLEIAKLSTSVTVAP